MLQSTAMVQLSAFNQRTRLARRAMPSLQMANCSPTSSSERAHRAAAVSPVVTDGSASPGVMAYAVDPDTAAALWARSEELVGEQFAI